MSFFYRLKTEPPNDFRRTVVFIVKETIVGQNLFLRGGLGSEHFTECVEPQDYTSDCAIPIQVKIKRQTKVLIQSIQLN